MHKFFKYLAIAILLCLLIIAISIGVIIKFVNPNEFKSTLQQQVQRITGQELIIKGDLHWSFFPWLALQVNDAQLNNPPGFTDTPLAKLAMADVQLKLMPLVHHKIEIGKINLKGLQVVLIKKANGDVNWKKLQQPVDTTTQEKSENKIEARQVAMAPLALSVANVEITDAKISFNDQQKHQHYSIDHLQLHGNKINLDKAFPFQLSFDFNNNQEYVGKFNLESEVTLQLPQQQYLLMHTNLQLKMDAKNLPQPVNLKLLADVNATPAKITATNLKVQLDDSVMTGKAGFNIIKKQTTFDVVVDRLDLNRYVANKAATPAATNAQKIANTPASPAVATAVISKELPIETLKNLNVIGSLSIGELQVATLQAQAVQLNIKANEGMLRIAPITANLYQGKYQGELTLNTRNAEPRFHFKESLTNVQLAPMLKDEKKRFELTGTLNLNAELNAEGANTSKLIKTMTGSANVKILNGALKGIDAGYQVRRAQAYLKHQAEPVQTGSNQTDFGSLTATYTIQNGKASNDDLLLLSPIVKMTGKGVIDIAAPHFDYQFLATVLGSGLDQQAKDVQEYIGGGVPLRVSGNFEHYKVTPDWDVLGRAVVKSAIKEHAEKLKIKVGEKLEKALGSEAGKKLKEQLQSFFH